MRIGVLSDTHLGLVQYGLKEREQDFYDAYFLAISKFIEANVDLVIIAGDVFDKPRPSPKALEVFIKGLSLLSENGIKVCNIIGNHAMIQNPTFVTADELITSVPGLNDNYILLNEDISFESDADDLEVMGLPFYNNIDIDKMISVIYDMNEYAGESDKTSILVLHQAFAEFCGFSGEELSIRDINISNFDLVICGHIHERIVADLGSTVFLQPGSLERLTVAEARDEEVNGKGIFIFDTDDINITSITNGFYRFAYPRKFLIADMYMDNANDIDDIRREISVEIQDCIEKPILFLTVHDKSGSFVTLLELTKIMNDKCLTVNFNYFDETVQPTSLLAQHGDIPSVQEALKISLNPLDKEEFELGLDVYNLLKDGKDVLNLINEFIVKRSQEYKTEITRDYNDQELQEIENFFRSI